MAYTELDRVYIRKWVGYGAIFLQAEPRLENAITTTQAFADGGGRPDSSVENYIKGLIYGAAVVAGNAVTPGATAQSGPFLQPPLQGILYIEQQLQVMWSFTFALKADNEAEIDPARGIALLRKEGRRLCHSLARMLGMRGVRADMFSAAPVIVDDDPFSYSEMEHWRRGP